MRMPSVTIISPDPANQAGGTERVCALLAETLERQGWCTTIVGPHRPPTQWEFRLGLGHPVKSLSATRAAREGRPDLVISNGYLGVGISSRIPRVHVYHGTLAAGTRALAGGLPTREVVRRSLSAGLLEAIAGRGAARAVCVSQTTADEVRRFYRIADTTVIPNGVDTTIFTPRNPIAARERLGLAPEGRYAIFVGRFEYGKGGDLALKAARRAGYELLVAGPTAPLGARHLGVLAPESLADAYGASDCVIFPTRYEGCSLVVLEALACGRPLITTRVGWMSTLLQAVPEYEALCVDPTLEDIFRRLSDLDQVDSSGLTKARAFVLEHNSLEQWAHQWKQLLAEIMNTPEERAMDPRSQS
jgi:glycosyltransferase involved in cell wall biosynthesis